MGFAFDNPTNPVGTVTESDIDTWWSKGAPETESWWDDADGYIRLQIVPGIPKGHNCKWGVNDAGNKYYLTISGSAINKTWS